MGNDSFNYSKMTPTRKQAINNIRETAKNSEPISNFGDWDCSVFENTTLKDWQANVKTNSVFGEISKLGTDDVFSIMDANGDGVVSKAEAQGFADVMHISTGSPEANNGKFNASDLIGLKTYSILNADDTPDPVVVPVSKGSEDIDTSKVKDADKDKGKINNQGDKESGSDDSLTVDLNQKGLPKDAYKRGRVTLGKDGNYTVTVEKWLGSDDKKYGDRDDDLYRIVLNSYKDANLSDKQVLDLCAEIGRINNIKNIRIVQPGQVIKLPALKLDKNGKFNGQYYTAGEVKNHFKSKTQGGDDGGGDDLKLTKLSDSKSDAFAKTTFNASQMKETKDAKGNITRTYYDADGNSVATSVITHPDNKYGTETNEIITKGDKMYRVHSYEPNTSGDKSPEPAHTETYELSKMTGTDSDKQVQKLFPTAVRVYEDADSKVYYDKDGNQVGSSLVKSETIDTSKTGCDKITETIVTADGTKYEILTTKDSAGVKTTVTKKYVKNKDGSSTVTTTDIDGKELKKEKIAAPVTVDSIKAEADQLSGDAHKYPNIDKNKRMAEIFNEIPKDELRQFISDYDEKNGVGSFMQDIGYSAGIKGEYHDSDKLKLNEDVYNAIKDAYKGDTLGLMKSLTGGTDGLLFDQLVDSLTAGDHDAVYDVANNTDTYKNTDDLKTLLEFFNHTFPSAKIDREVKSAEKVFNQKYELFNDSKNTSPVYTAEITKAKQLYDKGGSKNTGKAAFVSAPVTPEDLSGKTPKEIVDIISKEVKSSNTYTDKYSEIGKQKQLEAIFDSIPSDKLSDVIKEYDKEKEPGAFMKNIGFNLDPHGYGDDYGSYADKIIVAYKDKPIELMNALQDGSSKNEMLKELTNRLSNMFFMNDTAYQKDKVDYSDPAIVHTFVTYMTKTAPDSVSVDLKKLFVKNFLEAKKKNNNLKYSDEDLKAISSIISSLDS